MASGKEYLMSENYIVLVAMPVYGLRRSRKKPKLVGMLERGLSRLGIKANLWTAQEQIDLRKPRGELYEGLWNEDEIIRLSGKRVFIEGGPWGSVSADIGVVERSCGPIRDAIRERIEAGENSPVVVDWGCGNGTALTQIAREIPAAKCYGLSDQFFDAWKENTHATFIHATVDDFGRYLKPNSVDIAFSRLGIVHLNYLEQEKQLRMLARALKVGGKIFVDDINQLAFSRLQVMPGFELTAQRVLLGDYAHSAVLRRIF